MSQLRIDNKKITSYKLYLIEQYRPPSQGGNTSALHSHVLEIDGERYSFRAAGAQQWVYKSDTVSFVYEINEGYKNILAETMITRDRKNNTVIRGNRTEKKILRTAKTRLPASRREQRD